MRFSEEIVVAVTELEDGRRIAPEGVSENALSDDAITVVSSERSSASGRSGTCS